MRNGILAAICLMMSACATKPVCEKFDLNNVDTVVLRASTAEKSQVSHDVNESGVTVCGTPDGGAGGFHPGKLFWRETPVDEWGMGFKSMPYGDTLVISTFNEIKYIHHWYYLADLNVVLPKGIALKLENRELNGDGAADISAPVRGNEDD